MVEVSNMGLTKDPRPSEEPGKESAPLRQRPLYASTPSASRAAYYAKQAKRANSPYYSPSKSKKELEEKKQGGGENNGGGPRGGKCPFIKSF